MSAAQFQGPFHRGTKGRGSWVSAAKQAHKGSIPAQPAGLLGKLCGAWEIDPVLCCHPENCCAISVTFFFCCINRKQRVRFRFTTFPGIWHHLCYNSQRFPKYTIRCMFPATYNENFIPVIILEAFPAPIKNISRLQCGALSIWKCPCPVLPPCRKAPLSAEP